MRWRAMSSMSVSESYMAVLLPAGCPAGCRGWGSALVEGDVARGGGGADLEVRLALRGLAGAGQRGREAAARGADVGPHRRTSRDADADVAARGLGGDPARRGAADDEVAGPGGEDDVAVGADDPDVTRAGLDPGVAGEVLGDQVAGPRLDGGVAVDDVEGDVARARVDAGVGEAAVGDDVAAADLGAEAAGDGDLDDDLGAGVLAEETTVAPRGDDRDPVTEVAYVELLGAVAGDADGGLRRVGRGDVDEAAAVL